MPADDLEMQGAKESAAMVLTRSLKPYLSPYQKGSVLVSVPDGFKTKHLHAAKPFPFHGLFIDTLI